MADRKSTNNITDTRRIDDLTDINTQTEEIQDANQLTTIFPVEVWFIIFMEKIGMNSQSGTNTLTNVSLATPYFRKILEDQRKFFLFPKVLEIFTTWLEDRETKNGTSNNESDNGTENPTSNSLFKLTDILIFRGVCSQWNQMVEHVYQCTNRYAQMQHDNNKLSRNLCEIKMHRDLLEEEAGGQEEVILNKYRQPSSFLDHFKSTHETPTNKRSPFAGRSLTCGEIQLEDFGLLEPQYEIFSQGISQIFTLYGEHLWHLDMELTDMNFNDRINFYWKLKSWLTQTPNLRTLKLNCNHLFEAEQNDNPDEILDEMQSDILRNPLPELRNLQFLQVQNLAPVIFNELIRNCGQTLIQVDILRRQEARVAYDYDIYSKANQLVKLKELSINFCSERHFERMEHSEMASNWKLEKFYFLYDNDAEWPRLDWPSVLHMISKKWSGSLTNLVLQMPVLRNFADKGSILEATLSSTILQLPFLKRVKLIVKNPCSLDFLLPSCDTLECMEIFADYDVDTERRKIEYQMLIKRQCVKFLGFENSEVLESNIMEKFPRLSIFRIELQ